MRFKPRLVAWELTQACNLTCKHCRGSSIQEPESKELSTKEIKEVIDEISEIGNVIILTGGEPLLRDDLLEITRYGDKKGLKMVLATNGTLFGENKGIIDDLKQAGIKRVSISLDGSNPDTHDKFRGMDGAFERALEGINALREKGMPFQVNSTITKKNVSEVENIIELSQKLGAEAMHIFLLVPTGRGKDLEEQELSPQKYEDVLNWFFEKRNEYEMDFKATCAPHYYRILDQKGGELHEGGLDAKTGGCLGGKYFCFISKVGEVYPCGYLPVEAGNVRKESFREIWNNSKVFNDLRDPSKLKGKCGDCEYDKLCGGCRARAYAATGDYLGPEPYCVYQPNSG
ncbi:MAG: Radical SAM superfamily enzyme [Candidatus Methanohalarchaeum thermophilum]|uniref:Radical SAM superfamily enzyme n=1 Tax=Methanohalarchaeum thermophilum TaxID=1903181 RepID=A0A1Q6DUY5_METT1|nr:MAG: Radical SAM superfamily enzyme [Candidatus Methanohalarchaeum thermophilum]